MHLTIISGAARPKSKSNTARIIEAFCRGFVEDGGTAETWYLSDRAQWPQAAEAFAKSEHILIALPLYVENIPGILLEFLSGLALRNDREAELAFLVQGGFPEGSQSRCCESYLETLPAQLGARYAGTLIKGDMFGLGLVDGKSRERMLAPFTDMGRYFARTGRFDKATADDFAAPEYLPEKQIRSYRRVMGKVSRIAMGFVARRLGCKERLDARPLEETGAVGK